MVPNLFDALRAARPADELARPALRCAAGTLSYRALFEHVERLGARLVAAGVVPGEPVVVVAPNSPDLVVGLLAVLGARGVGVPVAADASPGRLERVRELTGARFGLVHYAGVARAAIPRVLRFRLADGLASLRCSEERGGMGGGSLPEVADAEAALILLSSGSTGRPKGVVLRHAGLVWTARALAGCFGLDAGHVELIVCPLVHSGAWQRAAATLWAGGTVVIPAGAVSITGLLEDCAAHAVGGFYTPPPLVRYLLKADASRVRAALAGLRSIEIGSAPVSAAELRGLLDLLPGVGVFVHYGLTECSRAVVLDAAAHPGRLDTVGRPLRGVEVQVRDPGMDRAGPPGEPGEIWLRGPQMAAGYWREPELTARTFVDGWVRTGDHGRLGDDGFLTFLGRRDDRITSAGFSFYPGEVEAELGAVDGVADYLIAGIPDPRGVLGEVPCAFVVPADPGAWEAVQWAAVARSRLPAHMVPRRVVVVEALPRTPSGKDDRRRTVEMYADRMGKD